ncbi:iron-sulfur cluster assembly scaffold protein Isu1 [Schizosaccharomyces cryophilus OY26]|uniref:Iron-sulfur cluster assembly protein n=1 Tax=Schizosaccharomyces cryophilus (strain OY26 / ATCC MYA-4695 / CBS 11777 / NBRC 106824 / NRRL Y48691) TaxID=653667 RepID=S9VTY7_SCHCR|nr:iron-sulfur cluster assembly scaffold protein Isu1 [Schizosaccharomyces cryophilus OY26]EPY49644.1 iron-sulfur cluster assembly scaffold protein Isu1 [Schizosaccharomyces cryophilus OY26]
MFSRSVQSVGRVSPLITQRFAGLGVASSLSGLRLANMNGASNIFAPSSFSSPRRLYHKNVLDHYNNPRNVGNLPKNDADVGVGLVGAPACGDVMRLAIRVNKDGVIEDVKFKTFGCGSAIASSSYVTTMVKGLTLEEAAKIKNTQIAKELSLPPVKLHCSMLAEDAIKSAVKNYRSKSLDDAAAAAKPAQAAGAA